MPQDPTLPPSQNYGPFTEALTGPLSPKAQQLTTNYAPSRAGAIALFANNFLSGLQQGRRTAYERSEKQKAESHQNFNTVYAHIMSDPTLSVGAKKQAESIYNETLGTQITEAATVAQRDSNNKENPLLHLAKSVGLAMAGPAADKKHKDYNAPLNALISLGRDPQYKIDPNALGNQAAQELTKAIDWQEKSLPRQDLNAGQPVAAQIPGLSLPEKQGQEATAGSVARDPAAQAALKPLTDQGIDPWTAPQTREILRTLPQTPKPVQPKPLSVSVPGVGADGKETRSTTTAYMGAQGQLFEQGTNKPLPPGTTVIGDSGAARTLAPPMSAAEKNKALLISAYKSLGKTDEEAQKEWASTATKTFENKSNLKATPEDNLARNIMDSGKAANLEDAKKQAASMIVDLEKAKVKAASTKGSASATFNPEELDALAKWARITGSTPSFGLGANNPNRDAFQRALAHQIIGGNGVGDALEQKADYKSLNSELTKLRGTYGQVAGFEQTAFKALDNALEASKTVHRDSSQVLNAWDQWLTNKTVDDPDLQQLIVFTETAANEYARVIGSLTGASTNAAREQANEFIKAQLAEKSFSGAAIAMKKDMINRTDSLSETIDSVGDQIKRIGEAHGADSGKPTTPPPGTQKPQAQQFTQQNPYTDASGKKVWIGMTGKDKNGNSIRITAIDPATGILTKEPVAK